MEKLRFSITIDAPREKVWQVMLNDETYREWTASFHPGSHFVGSWQEGSEMRFLGPSERGKQSGMYSRIKVCRPYEYISIEHLGFIENGKIDTTSDAVKKFIGAHENYSFNEQANKTELLIEMDSSEEFRKMFEDSWPKALAQLKIIAER